MDLLKRQNLMYVATLIAEPGKLDAQTAENLRNAWGGSIINFLSLYEAAEFLLSMHPSNFDEVWVDFQAMGIDLVLQKENNRRKKLLIADMDSTIIAQECIDELAQEAGVGEAVRKITAKAMNGEIDFYEALVDRMALLKGASQDIIKTVIEQRLSYISGADILVATMKANGAYTALVSGGFTVFTEHVSLKLGFEEHRANTLLIEDALLTGEVAKPILGKQAKVEALEELTTRLSIKDDDVIAVGDGANDLAMLGSAGMGVAMHAKPAVGASCDFKINFGDLTALLYLQGFSKDEFIVP